MIETMHLEKSFGSVKAVADVSLTIRDGEVFGLVGTNGAGKSTFLRLLAGVLRQDAGQILVDREKIWDNPEKKADFFFVPNDFYFFPNATPEEMGKYFAPLYPRFDAARYETLLRGFHLDKLRRIREFSRGMRRQVAILLGLCSGTKYLLLDETFDGLDPLMRQTVRSLIAKDMEDRGLTPVLSSHNLREIEDLCDHIGILHEGGILLSEDLEDLRKRMQKVQCVFSSEEEKKTILEGIRVVCETRRGRLSTLILEADRESVEAKFRAADMIFFEILPLTLEEIFVSKTEGAGYDVRKLILDSQ